MKNHFFTFVLLLLATAAFILRFFVRANYESLCDIAAFVLPTLAAVAEIIVSERSGEKMHDEIKKRPIWVDLTQEEFDRLRSEGKLDENTYYATYEEKD